jgi:D-beta-D-heptose 7-phosphate kinase/D-beta-D-heptose 1-phosphate adenosyltransferase
MILVIGESCLDVFHYGECNRLCPDAPVPVFKSIETKQNGGMAMNVFTNVKKIHNQVKIQTNVNWMNIKKTRFVELKSNHMFMRLDENDDTYGEFLLDKEYLSSFEAIIVSDYNKGFLSIEDLESISNLHPLTFLDTKKILGNWCKNFTFIKINGVEYNKTKHTIDSHMLSKMIITQGQNGCIYRDKTYTVPLVEVKDVSGAGDTFISGLCCEYIKTRNIEKSIRFANECATAVVQKRGVSTL